MGLVAAASLMRILLILPNPASAWRAALIPKREFWENQFTTYEKAVNGIVGFRSSRAITVGESLAYRFPARIVYGGQLWETPLIWKLVRESDSVKRLALKFRQLGASHLLYNYVGAEWMGLSYRSFSWDERMLRIYVDYCRLYQEMAWRTEACDYDNGGMVLFRLHHRPISPRQERVWFAPGTEQLYGAAPEMRARKKYREFLALAQRAHRLLPNVGTSWNELGYAYLLVGENEKAYSYLKEFADEGMMDGLNLVNYGIAALEIGKMEQGEKLLREALARCLGQHGNIIRNLARIEEMKRKAGN